jgi:hypothetical protein
MLKLTESPQYRLEEVGIEGCTEGGKESYNWRPSPLWAELSFCEQLMHPAEPLDYPIPSNGR